MSIIAANSLILATSSLLNEINPSSAANASFILASDNIPLLLSSISLVILVFGVFCPKALFTLFITPLFKNLLISFVLISAILESNCSNTAFISGLACSNVNPKSNIDFVIFSLASLRFAAFPTIFDQSTDLIDLLSITFSL